MIRWPIFTIYSSAPPPLKHLIPHGSSIVVFMRKIGFPVLAATNWSQIRKKNRPQKKHIANYIKNTLLLDHMFKKIYLLICFTYILKVLSPL